MGLFKKQETQSVDSLKESMNRIGYYISDELLRELSEEATKLWGARQKTSIANVAALLYEIHSRNLRIIHLKAATSLEFINKTRKAEIKTKSTSHRGQTLFCGNASLDKSIAMFVARMVRCNFDEKTRTYSWEIDEESIIPIKPFTVKNGMDLAKATDDMLQNIKLASSTADKYDVGKLSRMYSGYFNSL